MTLHPSLISTYEYDIRDIISYEILDLGESPRVSRVLLH
jgi:hypothetical protein